MPGWFGTWGSAAALLASAPGVAAPAHPRVDGATREACVACHASIIDRKVLHGPVAAGSCGDCHRYDAAESQMALEGVSAGDLTALCVRCHEDITGALREAHVHGPAKSGACTECHDPHGSAYRFQLAAPSREVCLRCHREVAEVLGGGFVHAPVVETCATCHDAHGAKYMAQLRQPLNALCLKCHEAGTDDAPAAAGTAPPAAEQRPAAGGSSREIHLDQRGTVGHPIRGHPVAARPDPANGGKPMTCVSCHNPHGGRARQLLRFEATSVSAVCVHCHTF